MIKVIALSISLSACSAPSPVGAFSIPQVSVIAKPYGIENGGILPFLLSQVGESAACGVLENTISAALRPTAYHSTQSAAAAPIIQFVS
jgi:hypothetical protein